QLRRATPWWAQPLAIVAVLGAFTGYSIWTAFFGPGPNHISEHANYLSPFFSPLIWKTGPVTPALWVLWAPLGFRATCYYYRKSYYRAFFWDPPACARPELPRPGRPGAGRPPPSPPGPPAPPPALPPPAPSSGPRRGAPSVSSGAAATGARAASPWCSTIC